MKLPVWREFGDATRDDAAVPKSPSVFKLRNRFAFVLGQAATILLAAA
jgi:hypothetical protein